MSMRRRMMMQALMVQGIDFSGNKCTGGSVYSFAFDWTGNTLRSTARSGFAGPQYIYAVFLSQNPPQNAKIPTSTSIFFSGMSVLSWSDPQKRCLITATVSDINSITGSNPNTSIGLFVVKGNRAVEGDTKAVLNIAIGTQLSIVADGSINGVGLVGRNPGTAWDIEFDIAIKEVE